LLHNDLIHPDAQRRINRNALCELAFADLVQKFCGLFLFFASMLCCAGFRLLVWAAGEGCGVQNSVGLRRA